MKKNVVHYLVAFILPILIFCIAMAAMNIYPFGDISFRVSDAISQYPGFFESLRDIHWFSLEIGLGANYYPIFTTYLMNPLNFLYLFFHNYQFDLFYALFILFKIGLIGLTMNIFLNYKRKINKKSWIFSTIYALSGFVSLYFWCYQFLDAIYMMPLIMIGLRKLVEENKSLMYYITLTMMIIMHYYTGYMCCIFSLIYFWFLMYNGDYDNKKQKVKNFIVTSLLSGLSCAFVLIPTMYSFMQGRQSYFDFSNLFGVYFNRLVGSFYNLSIGSSFSIESSLPFISTYCSIFVIAMVLLLLKDKNANKKYKRSVIIILLLYFISCFFNMFYLFWHMFQGPVGISGRFVFGFNIYLVLFAYDYFLNEKVVCSLKSKILLIVIMFILFFLAFLFKNKTFSGHYFFNDSVYTVTLVMSLILLCYYIFIGKKIKLYVLTIFLIFLELLTNCIFNLNVIKSFYHYENIDVKSGYDNIKNSSTVINKLKEDNQDFVRMNFYLGYNRGFVYHINDVNLFSSIYNYNLNSFLSDYIIETGYDHNFLYKHSFLMDGILGVKYFLNTYNPSSLVAVTKQDYVVNSLGFAIPFNEYLKDGIDVEDFYSLILDQDFKVKHLHPVKNLDNIVENDGIISLIDKEKSGFMTLSYDISCDCIVNLNVNLGAIFLNTHNADIRVNSWNVIKMFVNDREVNYNIYELKKGDNVKLVIRLDKEMEEINLDGVGDFAYVDKDLFVKAIDELNKNKVEDIVVNRFGFTGSFTSTNEKDLLLITIPYDRGIEIKIDGVKTNYEKYLNGVIGVKVDEGSHKIEFIYHIIGLRLGLVISLISVVIYFIRYYWKRFKR